MRRFSSYGPINTNGHYYAPRTELISLAFTQLMGDNPLDGGHYITVWAPRQTGKTWVMQQILFQLQKDPQFDVLKINLEILKDKENAGDILNIIARKIGEGLGKKISGIKEQDQFQEIFKKGNLNKPLILILDEFDALAETGINTIASAFRNIYVSRLDEMNKPTGEKTYLLHAVSLIGVRSVLGIENEKGSPFNVQRSVSIPNLTPEEVKGMFQWYEQESGQTIEPEVVETLYKETAGQPGLTSWLGELLTEKYNKEKTKPITMATWKYTYMYASQALPNNNILNVISKVNKEPYKTKTLELFRTDDKIEFQLEDKEINYLYMNGAIDMEENKESLNLYVKFANPFLQKRLFHYFSKEIFPRMGNLLPPFEDLNDTISDNFLNIRNIIGKYQKYLDQNKSWLLSEAPRRKDMRIFEAVYHFNLYRFLYDLLKQWKSSVTPEFPTGNGKIDLLVRHGEKLYGIELKSFTTEKGYKNALMQTAQYGQQLGLEEISLIFFIEAIDEKNKRLFEADFQHTHATGTITVKPVFVQTGL